MKFETKFDVGDFVYVIYEDKILQGKITNISIFCYKIGETPSIRIEYSIHLGSRGSSPWGCAKDEDEVFSKKEDILEKRWAI